MGKKYMRSEFVIDPETDRDLAEYVQGLKDTEDFSGFIRDLLRRAMSGDLLAQSDVFMLNEIEELKATLYAFSERLDQLEQKLELVEHSDPVHSPTETVANISDELAARLEMLELQVFGKAQTQTEIAREEALSAKLRKMSFTSLMQ